MVQGLKKMFGLEPGFALLAADALALGLYYSPHQNRSVSRGILP